MRGRVGPDEHHRKIRCVRERHEGDPRMAVHLRGRLGGHAHRPVGGDRRQPVIGVGHRHDLPGLCSGRPQRDGRRSGGGAQAHRMTGEIGQRQARPRRQLATGRDRGQASFVEQMGAGESARSRPAHQGHVRTSVGQACGAIVEPQQFQRDVRMCPPPPAQKGGGVTTEGRPRVAQPQGPGTQTRGVGRLIKSCDGGRRPGREVLTRRGEFQVVGGTVHQLDAEVGLELSQGAGQRRLGDVQQRSRSGDVALLRDEQEVAQVADLDGHACRA